METYQIVIIVICAVLLFLYFKKDCFEYFSVTGLNINQKSNIQNLIGLWRPIILTNADTKELEKVITNYSIGKHNIQLKKLSINKYIADDVKGTYWIDDKTSNYVDDTSMDVLKLNMAEDTISQKYETEIINALKPIISIDQSNTIGLNIQLDEMKKNLKYHGCLIKQDAISTLVNDNKIKNEFVEKAWFNCD